MIHISSNIIGLIGVPYLYPRPLSPYGGTLGAEARVIWGLLGFQGSQARAPINPVTTSRRLPGEPRTARSAANAPVAGFDAPTASSRKSLQPFGISQSTILTADHKALNRGAMLIVLDNHAD